MSRAQNSIAGLGGTIVTVGLSAIVKLSASNFRDALAIKIFAGGGTLEVLPFNFTALSGTGATGWGTGYPIGANEVITLGSGSIAYLAATGATMQAACLVGYTDGVSLPV